MVVGDKGGGHATPIVLKLGLEDDHGQPGGPYVRQFAAELERISGHLLTAEITYRAEGNGVNSWDQEVAKMIQRGDFDLGMVPARAFDELGVTSLRALQAPFLLTDDDAADEVASGELPADLMSGLPAAGFEGLALWPAELRHPASFHTPIVNLADFKDFAIRAPLSRVSYDLLEALGAHPLDLAEYRPSNADGAETAFALNTPAQIVITANITFFPKFQTLVANSAALARLTPQQRSFILEAADATTTWVIQNRVREAAAAAQHCKGGGVIALAADRDVAAIVAAAAPVYSNLESDPLTQRLIADIRGVVTKHAEPSRALKPCGSMAASSPAPSTRPTPTGDPSVLNGVYRADISEAFLLSQGVDPANAYWDGGIFTLTFKDGQFIHHLGRDDSTCSGPYIVAGSRLTVSCTGTRDTFDPLFTATWTLQDGELRFTDVRPRPDLLAQAMWGGKPFVRIADAP